MTSASLVGQLCRHFLAQGDGYVTLFKLYLDEGGINEGAPVLNVAGYLAKGSAWQKFTREWTNILRPTGISCYHATDAQALRDEFKGWTDTQVAALCSKLLPLIPKYAVGMSFSINMNDFNAALAGRDRLRALFPSPYSACFHWCILHLVHLARQVSPRAKFAVVHERNDMQCEAQEAYDWIKENHDKAGQLVSLSFADCVDFVPLQAADILCFEAGKRVRNLNGRPRTPWTILSPEHKGVLTMYYDKSNMHKLVSNLETVYAKIQKLDAGEALLKSLL